MKTRKICQALFTYIATSVLFICSSSAQVVLPEVIVTSTNTSAVVNEKVAKSFANSFKAKDIADVKWYEINKRYLVKFIMNDLRNQAVFTKNGSLVYHLSYGYEKNLPKDVRSQVKSKYFDYNITHAINVKQDERNIWMVDMADDDEFISVSVEDGRMSEIQKLSKSSPELTSDIKN